MAPVYSLRAFGAMIADRVRMDAYTLALRRAVKPGSVVVDIGTGTGIFALLACRFGARRVFAIEPDDVIQVARELATANGFADRIEFIQDHSTRVTLPERADVVIADVRGGLPGLQVPTLIDARRRLLAPGGTLIPQRDTLWAAVVDVPALFGSLVDPWVVHGEGLDMRLARRMVTNQVHKTRRGPLTPEQFLTDPHTWGDIDYTRIESTETAGDLRWTATRSGTCHGVVAWFDTVVAEGIGFSNTPLAPELVYGSLFFPWSDPVPITAGDSVAVSLQCRGVGDESLWCWNTRVTGPGEPGVEKAGFRQSEFYGAPVSLERLREREAGHVPRLNEDGEIDRLVLDSIDGANRLEDLARLAAARFPKRFPRWEDALTRVSDLARTYHPR
jgi:protein arginine N-methyltransferase 1